MTLSIDELIDDYERDGVKRMSRGEQKAWYKHKRRAMEGVFEVSWVSFEVEGRDGGRVLRLCW